MRTFAVLSDSAESTRKLGQAIGERFSGGETVLLSGPLGAGKTTLVQGIAAGLGVRGSVQSPSFVLERIHRGRLILRHLDFYRLSPAEVAEAGLLEERCESDVTVVEWAERAGEIPDATLRILLSIVPGMTEGRTIVIEAVAPEWEEKVDDAVRESGVQRA